MQSYTAEKIWKELAGKSRARLNAGLAGLCLFGDASPIIVGAIEKSDTSQEIKITPQSLIQCAKNELVGVPLNRRFVFTIHRHKIEF